MSNSSKLLIDEHPLQVLPTLAKLIGLNEAIVLQQVHYWLKIAEVSKDEYKRREGRWWTYGSVKEWQEKNFPFWSENTVQRIFSNLEQAGLLVSKKFNAAKYDHTKWYSIDYEVLNAVTEPTTGDEPITPSCGNQDTQDGAILILTETSPETSTENSSSKGFEEKSDEPAGKPDPYKAFVQKITTDYPVLSFMNTGQAIELGALFDKYGEKVLLDIAAWMNASSNKLSSMPQYLKFATLKAQGWNMEPKPTTPAQYKPQLPQPKLKAYRGPNNEIQYMEG